jgi:hypothetical protein
VCVIVYSDLFLNLVIECKPILACMSLLGYYLNGEESLCYSRMMRKVIIIPEWRERL